MTSGLVEVAVLGHAFGGTRTNAEFVLLAPARFVPSVAVGRPDGRTHDLPTVDSVVGIAVLAVAVVVLAPLPEVMVALVEATLLDEELFALARELAAPIRRVVVGVKIALLRVADAVGRRRRGNATTSATNAIRRKTRSSERDQVVIQFRDRRTRRFVVTGEVRPKV